MIHFESVLLEGFGSIVNALEYQLDSQGINVLQARNGIGKTTIFSGFHWVLYGKTLKNKNQVASWEDVRTKKWRGTMGRVIFYAKDVKITVLRYEKFKINKRQETKLVLLINDTESKIKDKREIQAEINKLLGFSSELFKNSALFGQKMKRIIEEDGPTRKKVFDEAFEIGYLQNAREITEKEKKELLIEKAKNDLALNSKNELLKELQNQLITLENTNKDFELKKKTRLEHKNKELSDFKAELNSIKVFPPGVLESKLFRLKNRLDKLEVKSKQKFTLEFKVENLLGDVDNLRKKKNDLKKQFTQVIKTCLVCGGRLSDSKIKEEKEKIRKEINKSEESINKTLSKVTKLKESILLLGLDQNAAMEIKQKVYRLENKIKENLSKTNDISYLTKSIAKCKKEISQLKSEKLVIGIPAIRKKIVKVSCDLLPFVKLNTHYVKQLELKEWLIKDPLSNSGIKAFIFEEMLKSVNLQLDTYSNILGFKINFGIDLESSNKDFYIAIEKGNSIRLYEDFSGGEQQLINICIAFSIHDVVCIDKNINILIMDEVFEGLDAENIEVVSQLIAQKAQGKSIHIITHHNGFNPINANILTLIKKKGRTELV